MPEDRSRISRDIQALSSMSDGALRKITNLLSCQTVSESKFHAAVPVYFQRLLFAYATLRESHSLEQLQDDEKSQDVTALLDWLTSRLPDIESQPGYQRFVDLSKKKLQEEGLLESGENTSLIRQRVSDMKIVTRYGCDPILHGNSRRPMLRVFFQNHDQTLLDSTGDWDDWLFVAKNLINSIDEQATSLEDIPKAWDDVPWEKVSSHLAECKKSLRSLEKQIKKRIPAEAAPKARIKKKKKATKS